MTPPITGAELRRYMTEKDLTLEDMGHLLGGKVATTIMRWQNGADIPGDTQILLKLLIRGEMPFQEESTPRQVRDAMWELEMSLGTWEEINRRRLAGGYATVTDWIASLVREELHEQQNRGDFKTADQAPPALALSAEDTNPPPVTEPRQEVVYGETSTGKKKP